MPFNGSGDFSLDGPPYVNGEVIDATTVNSRLQDIAQGLSNAVTRDGQSPATGNVPMGDFRITDLGEGVAASDAARLSQVTMRFIERQEASGTPTYLTFELPSGFTQFQFDVEGLIPTADAYPFAQTSFDGSTYDAGGSDYNYGWYGCYTPGFVAPASAALIGLAFETYALGGGFMGQVTLVPGTVARGTIVNSQGITGTPAAGLIGTTFIGGCLLLGRPTHVRLGFNATTIKNGGRVTLSGIPAAV